MYYNEQLADDKGLSLQDRQDLDEIYEVMFNCINNPKDFDNPVQFIEDCEYSLQGLFKFSQLKSMHKYWLAIKSCDCPVYENYDLLGWGPRVISQSCPWHSKEGIKYDTQ